MNTRKLFALIVVSSLAAIWLGSALNRFTLDANSAFANEANGLIVNTPAASSVRRPAPQYLPIILLNASLDGFWSLSGNGGTNPATHFLGTTDGVTLTLRVSNTVAFRLSPAYGNYLGVTSPNVIGGHQANEVAYGVVGATIGGGGDAGLNNYVSDHYGTVAGGRGNWAGDGDSNVSSALFAAVGGGYKNWASGPYAFVGSGSLNTASGQWAVVGGGRSNRATGDWSFVGGGDANKANGAYYATVGGGFTNSASGSSATVPGGAYNVALGAYSFAAGRNAQANHDGAFVWSDCNPCGAANTPFASTTANQFLIRASEGVGIGTNAPVAALEVNRSGGNSQYLVGKFKNTSPSGDLTTIVDLENGNATAILWRVAVGGTGNGLGLTNGQFYLERYPVGAALTIDTSRNFTLTPSVGSCTLTSGASGWACSSDRNLKENFKAVDARAVLARVNELELTTWNTQGATAKHLGPMAQDFYAAFGLGEDDRHINTVDAQGVALAAIQGLAQENQELKAQNAAQQKQINDLAARLTALEQQSPSPVSLNTLVIGALVLGAFVIGRRGRAR